MRTKTLPGPGGAIGVRLTAGEPAGFSKKTACIYFGISAIAILATLGQRLIGGDNLLSP